MKIALVTIATPEYEIGRDVLIRSIEAYSDISHVDHVWLHQQVKYANLPLRDERFASATSKIDCFSFKGYDRVVYMDTDMVCTDDISSLFSPREFRDHDVYMAPSLSWRAKHGRPNSRTKRLKLYESRYGRPMCNSGLIVINRFANSAPLEMADIIREGESYDHADQGAINEYIHRNDWSLGILDIGYNYFNSYAKNFPDLDCRIRVLHYIGRAKPWTDVCDMDEYWWNMT